MHVWSADRPHLARLTGLLHPGMNAHVYLGAFMLSLACLTLFALLASGLSSSASSTSTSLFFPPLRLLGRLRPGAPLSESELGGTRGLDLPLLPPVLAPPVGLLFLGRVKPLAMVRSLSNARRKPQPLSWSDRFSASLPRS